MEDLFLCPKIGVSRANIGNMKTDNFKVIKTLLVLGKNIKKSIAYIGK